jgi:uncharacterized protein (TIGR00730 family)
VNAIRNVTVYCSSSDHVAAPFFAAADELGRALAAQNWGLVYGGNRIGVMGRLADAARSAGGRVIGITPQHFIDSGAGDDLCHELIVTPDMRQRKSLLESRGDALIVMPGGIGTLEEFFEVLVGKTLHLHDKPLVLLNIENYFAPLLTMLADGVEKRFVRPKAATLYFVASTVAQAISYLQTTPAPPSAEIFPASLM